MDMRVFRNICQEYYDTKDYKNCYEINMAMEDSGKVVVTRSDEYYAYIYKDWEDLYKSEVRYCIEDDFNDIGEDEVRDYLDEEAYKYVVYDLGVEINEQI